jgi:dethiobiotin synthetase
MIETPKRGLRLGITGTDTGVGKTIIAAGIVSVLRQSGLTVGVLKPVEAGEPAMDAELLRAAAGSDQPLEEVRPILFPDPVAPMVAAMRAGIEIDLESMNIAYRRAETRAATVVEGAGGLLVPITPTVSFADLFRLWGLELVVVSANRLGVINHTLLTARAAREYGLHVRAIALNEISPIASDPSALSNADALRMLLPGIPVVSFPWVADAGDISAIAEATRRCGLVDVLLGSRE